MAKIRVLVMDVDGTLTDGRIHIGQDGELFKSFYCRDGLGILNIAEHGILPVILTSRISNIVINRAKELGIEHILQGAGNDKQNVLTVFVKAQHLSFENVAYIGDDINDLECMKLCSVVACPQNAVPEVKEIANYICKHNGGDGAVREFTDWLLKML